MNTNYQPKHIPPSFDPQDFQNVIRCNQCQLHISQVDSTPGTFCARCGSTNLEFGLTGRWVRQSPRWQFWKNEGYWHLLQSRPQRLTPVSFTYLDSGGLL